LEAPEDELGAEDHEVDDLEATDTAEAEVSITDEEAQDIIDLADKLRAATGDPSDETPEEEPPDEEVEMGMELSAETPEEEMMQEKTVPSLDELKEAIYKKVIERLLKEAKKK
jgi:hypothetical protein